MATSQRSTSASDVDTRRYKNLQIFRYLLQNSNEIQQDPGSLISHLLNTFRHQGIDRIENINTGDVLQNEAFIQLLKHLKNLGICAATDLEEIEALKTKEPKVLGLTGAVLNEPMEQCEQESAEANILHNEVEKLQTRVDFQRQLKKVEDKVKTLQGEFQQNLAGWMNKLEDLRRNYQETSQALMNGQLNHEMSEKQMQISVERDQEMEETFKSLSKQIEEYVTDTEWLSEFEHLAEDLKNLMVCWRCLQALMHVECHHETSEQIQAYYKQFHNMFTQAFTMIQQTESKLADVNGTEALKKACHEVSQKIMSDAWCVESHPTAVLKSSKGFIIESLTLRIFGMGGVTSDCNLKVVSEGGTKLVNVTCQKQLVKTDIDRGITVSYHQLDLQGIRSQKRGADFSSSACQQLYRIMCTLKGQECKEIRCLTLPFTLRTGSSQLWPCQGAVTWCCYTASEWDKEILQYPRKLPVQKVLSMLQALMLVQDPGKSFTCEEKEALVMVMTHNNKRKSDVITMEEFMTNPMSPKEKEKYPFFAWYVAAINTHKILIGQHGVMRECPDFINKEQFERKDPPEGNALIRISRNCVESPTGQTPYAHVVVHVRQDGKMLSCGFTVDEIRRDSLIGCIESLKHHSKQILVQTVLKYSLEDLKAVHDGSSAKCAVNHYGTVYRKCKDIILSPSEEMASLNLNSETTGKDGHDFLGVRPKCAKLSGCLQTSTAAKGASTISLQGVGQIGRHKHAELQQQGGLDEFSSIRIEDLVQGKEDLQLYESLSPVSSNDEQALFDMLKGPLTKE